MIPEHQFQSSPPPSATSFNFQYSHHHQYNNGDNHRHPQMAHPPRAKTDFAKESEEEETGHLARLNKAVGPSSTCVVTMPSCPSTSTSAYSSPSSENMQNSYGRHQSKELHALPLTTPSETDEFHARNIGMASTLVVSYLIEVTVQVLLTVQCYRSIQQHQQPDVLINETEVTSSSSSTSPWFWFLIVSSVLSSFLVTLISIIWVFRGMDFSGRLCGRLLCYVMHSFLLGLLWRYLKLAFAYDKADLEEFFKLKIIQNYVQSLPLVTIHLAWVLTTQQQLLPIVDSYHALSSWLVVVEMLSTVISLLILSSSTVSSFTCSNNNNLQGVVAAAATASPSSITTCPADKCNASNQKSKDCGNSNKLKVESGKGDNNRNHHFNDSGTASSVDNHGAVGDENDIEKKSSCSSVSPLRRLMTKAIKWMMSHYSQKCEPGRALLLVSRVISLGMLAFKMNYYWTGFITLLHFGVSFVWLGCWATLPSGKSNGNIRVTSNSSSSATTCRVVNDCNDTCCDTSSNDSGLVVQSELLMENGVPVVVVPANDGDVNAGVDVDDNDDDHNNMDYGVGRCTRGRSRASNGCQIKNETKGDHVNRLNSLSGGLSSCLSVVVHRRNNAGNDNIRKLATNNGFTQKLENQRQVLMRVLPLTYVLFWDLSNSPCVYHLSSGNPITQKRLNSWATTLPVLLAIVENVFITIYHHIWYSSESNIRLLTVSNATCLLLGWFLVAVYQFRGRSFQRKEHRKGMPNNEQVESTNDDDEEDDVDSGYGKNKGSSGIAGVKSFNKKETGECLSFCCSSLSHPLNIKRKGRRDQQQHDVMHTFCKESPNNKLSSSEHQHQPCDVTFVKYNEYQEQQDLGKLMAMQQRQYPYNLSRNKSTEDSSGSRSNSTIKSKIVTKKATIFPDLGIPSDHTGVNMCREEFEDNNDNFKNCSSSRPEQMMRYREDERMTTKACGRITTTPSCEPVTNNNYTNIKEALTRRISSKSCTNDSLKKSHQYLNQTSQDRESVKGDGELCTEEGETRVAISSFKSSSSPSTRLHQQQQQQHHSTTSNSNKCMPISIKSPISWLPETCCNDSSGSGGSSNSRNTNTLVMPEPTATNESRLFYCPEKYIDLGTKASTEETEESKRTTRKQQPKQQRQHHHNQNPDKEGNCDFSVVFFEGRSGGGTGRSYKQKQSRTPVASNALLLRAARSANTTPVASSKPFPLDIGGTPSVSSVYQQNHPYFLPSHRTVHDDDDEVDPIERATKGATHRQIRNQITGKTYLSDGASLTSLDGLCEIRASTPVEIKKASRVIVNYPPPHHQISDSKTVSRCLCKVDTSPSPEGAKNNRKQCGMSPLLFNGCPDDHHLVQAGGRNSNNNNIYEKLIDDSYGILICEGEHALGKNSLNRKECCKKSGKDTSDDDHHYHRQIARLSDTADLRRTTGGGGGCQKLRILCAKCLQNHDPLLTNCVDPRSIADDDHHHLPEVVGHYNNPTINDATMMRNWQDEQSQYPKVPAVSQSPYPYAPADSDTTDYPSDTEFTTNNNQVEDDGQSLSTHFSSATYTWHNHQQNNYHRHPHSQNQEQPRPTQLSQFIWAASTMIPSLGGCDDGGDSSQQRCPKEFTGLEYVRTWLMASHPRTFAINNISHNNNNNNSSGSGCNNTHQHPDHHQPLQQDNGIKRHGKNSGSLRRYAAHQNHLHTRNDKGLTVLSSATSKNNSVPLKHKSTCDKTISKKKRFRHLEKRQRPIGRGASPPAKELAAASNNINGNVDALNSISATATTSTITNTLPTTSDSAARDDCSVDASVSARFQPPPTRKQHPLLFYDMIPRQEQQKPLTATSHKKCRDQLDLFHKELETVV